MMKLNLGAGTAVSVIDRDWLAAQQLLPFSHHFEKDQGKGGPAEEAAPSERYESKFFLSLLFSSQLN